MKLKRAALVTASLGVLLVFLALFLASGAMAATDVFVTHQLTVDGAIDPEPQVSGRRIVWQSEGGSDGGIDTEIFTATLASATFPDVPASHPYYAAISELSSRNVITGYTDGRFGPTDAVVRQQFAKMIVLALELEPLPAEQCPFADVDPGWPYPRGYIATAAERGITTGTTPGTFSPWDTISRAQVVTMVVRALDNPAPGTLRTPPAAYTGTLGSFDPTHGPTMATAEHNGLLEGLLGFGSSWDPWANASRGEVAQVLWNALQLQAAGPGWLTVASFYYHSLAIKSDGSLWAWGPNDHGQLGDGTTENRLSPTRVGTDTDWKAVATGRVHSLALKTDGSLWTWGSNSSGQLGDGTTEERHVPTRIDSATDWQVVAAGYFHSLAIKSDGSLWAWGANWNGRLGDGTTTDRHEPTRIGSDTDWAVVAAGWSDSFGIKTDGSLWAWGCNEGGCLGDGTTTDRHEPTRIGSDTDWTAVSAGLYHSMALKSNGSLWTWGSGTSGQLGDGPVAEHLVPTRIGSDTDWTIVAAGGWHSLALKEDGSLWGWGLNDQGRLGDGTQRERDVPTRIGSDTDWTVVAAGGWHSHGIKTDGSLWSWGSNNMGQLGLGDGVTRTSPALVSSE